MPNNKNYESKLEECNREQTLTALAILVNATASTMTIIRDTAIQADCTNIAEVHRVFNSLEVIEQNLHRIEAMVDIISDNADSLSCKLLPST